jgi:hypothetical protein
MEQSLWHGYLESYPVYTCLFFPCTPKNQALPVSFNLSLETHRFLKIQIFKLLANHQNILHVSKIKSVTRYLRKFLSLQTYQHLNTSEYLQVKTECALYEFCKHLKTSKENLEDKERLPDGSQFVAQEASEDKRWINEAGIHLRNFFKIFCIKPGVWREKGTRGEDKSKRAKYNRTMGLVLSSKVKQEHNLDNIGLDNNTANLKRIRPTKASLSNLASSILEEEKSDDIDDEIQTEELIWNQSKPCELNNPIASLINTQRLLPHIALNNQLLRPRAIKKEIQKALFIITRTAEILSDGVTLFTIEHVKDCLRWLILILTGRVINQIETEAFFLNETNIYLDDENSFIRIAFPQYMHRENLSNKYVYIPTEIEELELILPEEIRLILKPMISFLKKRKPDNKSEIQINTKNKKSAFNDWNTSEIRLQTQRSYAEITSDSWLLSVISWQSSGLSNTQKHYASCTVKTMQTIFEKHIQTFLNIDCKTTKWSNQTDARIGSPYYLNAKTYRQIIKQLWQNASPLFDQLNYKSIKLNELKFRFNSLAFWIDSYCSFAAATRNITDPLIQKDLVSHEGLYRVNDKNKYNGFNTRIVFVPATLLTKLEAYKKVRQKVLIYLRKTQNLSAKDEEILRTNKLFFFKQNTQGFLKIVEYTRSRCRDEIYWQANTDIDIGTGKNDLLVYENLRAIKTNVNRHYLRGRLLEFGIPGFFIDAFMGHWHAGTQPWGQMSIFNQSHYLEQLKKFIPKILNELAFNVRETGL